jgi:hypothetical protein
MCGIVGSSNALWALSEESERENVCVREREREQKKRKKANDDNNCCKIMEGEVRRSLSSFWAPPDSLKPFTFLSSYCSGHTRKLKANSPSRSPYHVFS